MGDIKRFENANHFASDWGTAPVERGSGKNTRWCVNVSGNRQLNPVLHLMALTRLRCDEQSKTCGAKKEQEGKTRRAALRALKTHLARELYRTWQASHAGGRTPAPSEDLSPRQLDIPGLGTEVPDSAQHINLPQAVPGIAAEINVRRMLGDAGRVILTLNPCTLEP
ncbi:transposase (plasmid) [Deinococcus sp. QL22]|nr:transposase [Deinococcus sp. QL22]UQN08532.1 transposase [Deinococcus sp. QL22]